MNKLFDCIINKNTTSIPIWFMRQAGRYLPEFREIRKKNQNFIELCLTPKLVKEITLQPIKRFKLDATIIFSDILIVPYGLGQTIDFKKGYGPVLQNFELENIMNTKKDDFIKKVLPVYDGLRKVKNETKNESLIGFVGAPWTLLVYMLNKQSPKKNFSFDIINSYKSIDKLLQKIEDIICLHIEKQVEAGANIIQIFDSWAGLLPKDQIQKYCYIPNSKIVDFVKSLKIPVICFPRGIGENYADFCSFVKPNCISIDSNVDPEWIKDKSNGIAIQGGIDPKALLTNKNNITNIVKKYLKIFSGYPYIFNLGHGVLPETDPMTIKYIVEMVKNK